MEKNAIISRLDSKVPGAILEVRRFGRTDWTSLWIEMSSVRRVAEALAGEPGLELAWLENFTVIEIDQALVFTYFVRSHASAEPWVIRGSIVPKLATTEIEAPSVTAVWPMAEPHEREAAALFGVRFTDPAPGADVTAANLGIEPGKHPLRKSFSLGAAMGGRA